MWLQVSLYGGDQVGQGGAQLSPLSDGVAMWSGPSIHAPTLSSHRPPLPGTSYQPACHSHMLGVYTGGCTLLPCTRLPGHHMLLHPLNLTDRSERGRTTEPLPRFDRRQLSAAPRIWVSCHCTKDRSTTGQTFLFKPWTIDKDMCGENIFWVCSWVYGKLVHCCTIFFWDLDWKYKYLIKKSKYKWKIK